MRRDDGYASETAEVVRDGNRQRRAFLGISRGTEFVEQYQLLCSRGVRNEIDIGDVSGES